MGGTLKGLGCSPIEINTEPDQELRAFLKAYEVEFDERLCGIEALAALQAA